MNLEQRIKAFARLGTFFKQFSNQKIEKNEGSELNNLFFEAFNMQINRAQEFNGWFTKENVLKSIESWSDALTEENLTKWTAAYNFDEKATPKNVAIIMAGNIPLVGFHDFLSVLITGNNAVVKLSSNDKNFLPLVVKFLEYYHSYFKGKVTFTTGKLDNYNAVIATGSDNTARYFEHYFGKYPNIIRKNRNSVAIITGNETNEELEGLGEDIFQYFGLGCRNVSKIYVPKNYNFDALFNALYKFKDIINYKKYENNYDYNKAVYLMSMFQILENGFLMLKEDKSFASPIASLFYEYYEDFETLTQELNSQSDQIQCIACNKKGDGFIKLGETQQPKLWEFADGVDTIEFLLKN
ncbi:acyl-CoA reductase [Lutibacter holmesii]|uniref:Acyl-CoA reductase n=1 Tax=Lutibacter holmesii TaxID=1137985 RepID=A0ABW3WQ61_9FLAO